MKTTAIILAAGKGKRMGTDISKQYLLLEGFPVLYYAIDVFEKSQVDNIILVTSKEDIDFCRINIVEKYNFTKIKAIIAGGKERYNSVHQGLNAIETMGISTDVVLIHDGARPFVNEKVIVDSINCAKEYGACVAAVKAKDTIKLSSKDGFIETTPDREAVWQIQTPQTFRYKLIKNAYDKVLGENPIGITDDAMVLEKSGFKRIKLMEASYDNIKLTTKEDLAFGQAILERKKSRKKV